MKLTKILYTLTIATIFTVGFGSVSFADTLPTPMDANALAAASGLGVDGNTSIAQVSSTISNNTIGDVGYTGGISNISATGNSGLTTMIENTGNQVSISTATVVNVNFH